jgi:hypothetical protein
MRELGMVLTLAFSVAGGLRAQATSPQVDVTGRAITLLMVRGPQQVRGELLAARRDSVWVLTGRPERVVAVRLRDVSEATVRRHGWTAARSFLWGLGVGAVSGVGLAVACSQVSDGCGGVAAGSTLFGGAVGGIAALSYQYSSRWRFRPVTEVKLAPFARFPQGPPPGGFDVLLRPTRDSVVVRP